MQKLFSYVGQWINKTTQRRLVVWSIGFWVISVSVISLAFLWFGQNQMLNDARQRNIQMASVVSRDINVQIGTIIEDARTFSNRFETFENDILEQATAIMGLRFALPRYRAVYFYDNKGSQLLHIDDTLQSLLAIQDSSILINRPPTAVTSEITKAREAVGGTDIYVSEVRYSQMDFTPIFYIGMPVNFPNGETNVIVFEIDLTETLQRIETVSIEQTGLTYAVSREGVIIAHPEPLYIGRKCPDEVQPVLVSIEGSGQFIEPVTKREVVAAYSPVGGATGWGIIVQQDREEIYATIFKTGSTIIGIWIILGLAGTIGIFPLIGGFTKPIKQLTKTTRDIARTGNLSKTSMLKRSDEVGQLSQAFDQMIDKVKAIENKLTSSEERYRSLFEHANDAIILIDDSGIIDCNHKAEEMFASNRDQIIHKSPSDLSPKNQPDGTDSHEKEQKLINLTFSGEAQIFEWRHRKFNGELFDAEVCLNRMNVDNKLILMAIIRDITERRRSAERLQESEQLFRSLVENSQAGIFTVDNMFRFTYGNDRLCQILGYSRDEIIGRDFREFLDEESKELVADRYIRRQQGQEVPSWYEFVIIQKSGVFRNVELSAAVVRDSLGKGTTVGQILDITERKKAQIDLQRAHDELESRVEQRTADLQTANTLLRKEIVQRQEAETLLQQSESKYRDIVENAASIILEMDTTGNVTFLNRFGQEYFGYSEDEIIGKNVVGTIVPEIDSHGDKVGIKIHELVRHPEQFELNENENIRHNGERVWVAWNNKGIYDRDGVLIAVHSIGLDRTAQVKEAAAKAQQVKEEAAVAERTRLARDLHDAVSQTLFSASIIAEVLPRIWDKNAEEGHRRLEEIRQLTRGALAEMRTLLFELRPAALADAEVGYLLHQLAESVTGRSRVPVEISVKGECHFPPEVKVALYRITQEALNNVAKHAGASRAKVELICESDVTSLTISDNGKGFDVGAVHPESLGLGIMRERAKGIGAELKFESKIGNGSKVVVKLKGTGMEVT